MTRITSTRLCLSSSPTLTPISILETTSVAVGMVQMMSSKLSTAAIAEIPTLPTNTRIKWFTISPRTV